MRRQNLNFNVKSLTGWLASLMVLLFLGVGLMAHAQNHPCFTDCNVTWLKQKSTKWMKIDRYGDQYCQVQIHYRVGEDCQGRKVFEMTDYKIGGNCTCFQVSTFMDHLKNKVIAEYEQLQQVLVPDESTCEAWGEIFYPTDYLRCTGALKEILPREPEPDTINGNPGYWMQVPFPCGTQCCLTEKNFAYDDNGDWTVSSTKVIGGPCPSYDSTTIPNYLDPPAWDNECSDDLNYDSFKVRIHEDYDGSPSCTKTCGNYAAPPSAPNNSTSQGNDIIQKQSIEAYPNPVKDEVTIELKAMKGESFKARIIDMDGKVHKEAALNGSSGVVSLESLSAGHYILKVVTGDSTYTGQLLKKD